MTAAATAQEVRTKETPSGTQSLVMEFRFAETFPAVSSICYIRGIFPEGCFSDRVLAGVNIKTLQPTTAESALVCRWLEEGVFDALSRKYLRAIIFGVYDDPSRPSTLLECYNFTITYPEEGAVQFGIESEASNKTVSVHTKEQIKKSTVNMLRTLISMASTLGPLPDERFLTVKLLYYDENTPADYEPKFFKAAPEGELGFENKPVKIKIGGISTPFHKMDLKIQTVVDSLTETQDEEKKKSRQKAAQQQHERKRELMYSVDENDDDEEKNGETSDDTAKEEEPSAVPVVAASKNVEPKPSQPETASKRNKRAKPGASQTVIEQSEKGVTMDIDHQEPRARKTLSVASKREAPGTGAVPANNNTVTGVKEASPIELRGRKRVEVPLSAQAESSVDALSAKVQKKLAKFEISDSQDTWISKRRISTVEDPILQKKRKTASQKEE